MYMYIYIYIIYIILLPNADDETGIAKRFDRTGSNKWIYIYIFD